MADLIEGAKQRKVVSEFQAIETAFVTYRLKYNDLPGDGENAYTFFGSDCAASAALCNGNGNKIIGETIGAGTYQEAFRFIQNLALAGLISGSYTGVVATPPVSGGNVIPSAYSQSAVYWPYAWELPDYYHAMSGTGSYTGPQKNFLHLGTTELAIYNWPHGPILTPLAAMNIDTKMDDGKPGTGKVIGGGRNYGCPSSTNMDTATYVVATTTPACSLGYIYY